MLVRRMTEGWDMSFGRGRHDFVSDAGATAQRVKTRLQLLYGEWFMDTSRGVPYLQEICVKPADIPMAESIIKRTILETAGVAEIVSFAMGFDAETRRLSVAARVRTIYDDISSIEVNLT